MFEEVGQPNTGPRRTVGSGSGVMLALVALGMVIAVGWLIHDLLSPRIEESGVRPVEVSYLPADQWPAQEE